MATLTRFAVAQLARTLAVLAGWPFTGGRCIARFRQTRHDGRLSSRTPARLIIVALLAFGLAFSPGYVQASHCSDRLVAAEFTRHADLGAEAISGHGHSHEDGDSDEQAPGHLHGHDPADHSHQLAFTPPAGAPPHRSIGQGWTMHIQTALRLAPDSGLERPPKRVLSI